MTNAEFKKKILDATEQEWFRNISVVFNFELSKQVEIKGVTAIYEFINQQIDGWNRLEELPNESKVNIAHLTSMKNTIIQFVNRNLKQNANYLKSYWQNQVQNKFNTKFLPYNIPEVEFLINIHQNFPNCFDGAYNFLTNDIKAQNIANSDYLQGCILAYEFTMKDQTDITKRKNAEEKSISKIRRDFQNYLSESEAELNTHLSNANDEYNEYVKSIDDLKEEKDKLFTEWFETSKNETDNFIENSKKEIENLEKTYEDKLKLEKPAKHWETRAKNMKDRGWLYLTILIALIACGSIFFSNILSDTPYKIFDWFGGDDKVLAIKGSVIFITLISFWAYCVGVVTKLMLSSFHISRDCEERYVLTYFYLSLKENSSVGDNEKMLIMQSLFSRADTGLLKDNGSPSMPSNVIEKFLPK